MRACVATTADRLGVSVHNLHSAGFNLLQRPAAQEEKTEPALWVLWSRWCSRVSRSQRGSFTHRLKYVVPHKWGHWELNRRQSVQLHLHRVIKDIVISLPIKTSGVLFRKKTHDTVQQCYLRWHFEHSGTTGGKWNTRRSVLFSDGGALDERPEHRK